MGIRNRTLKKGETCQGTPSARHPRNPWPTPTSAPTTLPGQLLHRMPWDTAPHTLVPSLSSNHPARGPLHGPSQASPLCTYFNFRNPARIPLCREPQTTPATAYFSFSDPAAMPLHKESRTPSASSHFSFNCPASTHSMQGALGPPCPMPNSAADIPPGQCQQSAPGPLAHTSQSSSQ